MARIRQQFPQNYGSSGNINTEFENLFRYLNAAELGDKTLGELLQTIFSTTGTWQGPVEFRKDASGDIQYRVGTYADETTGYITLVSAAELRGVSGSTAGTIGAPIIHSRQDTVISGTSTTVIDYAHDTTDELLVYVNGILKRSGGSNDYQSSPTAGTSSNGAVTFNSALSNADVVSIYKIRSTAITGFTRTDYVTTGTQSVFAFVHDSTSRLQVYKNGILMREGGANDYTTSSTTNTVTFNSGIASGNTVTVVTVENTSVQAVTGQMFEETYVHIDSGLIQLAKIKLDDNAIAQAKINGLSTALTAKAKLTVSSSTPSSPATGDLFLDTSQTPNQLKFYDGTQFLKTSPESSLPTFTSANASQFVKVNGTGTALEYGTVDLSSVVPVTQKGAANGVASLDSTGRLPSTQLPTVLSTDSFFTEVGTAANQTYTVKRIYKQKIRIDGIALRTTSGTCTVQIAVDGVGLGSSLSASSTPSETALGTPIEIDASTASKKIQFIVTSNSSASVLEVVMAVSVIAS